MKTNTATLRIMMLEQPNKQGLYPIVIRAQWNGRAERRTGIAIPKSAWAEKTSTIKPTYPNAQRLNITIQRMYNEVMQRKVELEMHGNLETIKDRGRDIERNETYGIVVLKYPVFARLFAI